MQGIKFQRLIMDTAWWAAHDIVLDAREIGYETTATGLRKKVGDGVKKWSELTYASLSAADIAVVDDGEYYDSGNVEGALQEIGAELGVQAEAIALKADKTQEAWITPTMTNGWVDLDAANFASCQYYKDSTGLVHLKGMIKSGTIGQSAFTLPVGYRVAKTQYFSTCSSNAYGQVNVSSTGTVTPSVGSTSWISLNGITFRAEA